MNLSRPTVFFDRDGVICEHVPFLHKLADFKFRQGTLAGIAKLHQKGYQILVCTNQPMLAMGLLTDQELLEIHQYMLDEVKKQGGNIDRIYFCPHSPTDRGAKNPRTELIKVCDCQKPKPGLFLQAKADFNIDLARSFMIGDSWRDFEFANNCGLKFIGVEGGDGFKHTQPVKFPTTGAAIDHLLALDI